MGLFKKHKKEEENRGITKSLELPKLPELPVFSDFNTSKNTSLPELPKDFRQLAQLPSFPTSSFGQKFSQNTIKNAITGQEENEEEIYDEEQEIPMIPSPLKKRVIENYESENKEDAFQKESFEKKKATREETPIFIRIDKFENSSKIFEQTKKQIRELENLLKETKDIKQKENQELTSWEAEIQQLKSKIEKIDQDIFSKVR